MLLLLPLITLWRISASCEPSRCRHSHGPHYYSFTVSRRLIDVLSRSSQNLHCMSRTLSTLTPGIRPSRLFALTMRSASVASTQSLKFNNSTSKKWSQNPTARIQWTFFLGIFGLQSDFAVTKKLTFWSTLSRPLASEIPTRAKEFVSPAVIIFVPYLRPQSRLLPS